MRDNAAKSEGALMSSDTLSHFHVKTLHHGWVEVFLRTADASFRANVSYTPNDGLREFLAAVNAVLPHPGATGRCLWSDERGFYLVTLQHEPPNITLLIQYAPGFISRFDGEQPNAEIVFRGYCEVKKFARKVRATYRRLLDEIGVVEYQTQWRHPFPQSEWEQLQAFLAS